MKKIISIIMILVMAICVFTGCDSSASNKTSSGKAKVLFTVANSKNTFVSTIVDVMKSYSKSNGIDLTVEDANADTATQVDQIRSAKSNGYDAIICILVDSDTVQQVISVSNDLPIVFMNVKPDERKLKVDKYVYVASNESQVTDLQLQYLLNYFNNKSSFNAVLLEGDPSSAATKERTEGLKSKLKKAGVNVNYVFQDNADWSRDKAKEMFKVFLTMNKQYDCVICNNDDMALGVIDALEEKGIDPSKVPIIGIDATVDGCKAILDGKMAFTVKQSVGEQGESAIKAAQALAGGGTIKNMDYLTDNGLNILHPFIPVDSNNVKEYMK